MFYRFLDGCTCQTMPIHRNVLKFNTNKEDIMGYNKKSHLEWTYIKSARNYHSNLNLLSNHLNPINDMPNPLQTLNYLLSGLTSIVYYLWLLGNWTYCYINKDLLLSNHLFLRILVSVTIAKDPLCIIFMKIYLIRRGKWLVAM